MEKNRPKQKKLTITESLEIAKQEITKLQVELNTEKAKADSAAVEMRVALKKKDEQAVDVILTIINSMGVVPTHTYGQDFWQVQNKESLSTVSGRLMSEIARVLEKGNLQLAIIQELEDQVEWFRSLIERSFGAKVIVSKASMESVGFGKWKCKKCGHEVEHIGNAADKCTNCKK